MIDELMARRTAHCHYCGAEMIFSITRAIELRRQACAATDCRASDALSERLERPIGAFAGLFNPGAIVQAQYKSSDLSFRPDAFAWVMKDLL